MKILQVQQDQILSSHSYKRKPGRTMECQGSLLIYLKSEPRKQQEGHNE